MAVDKFIIIKGVDNEYTFTVKANNSLLPMPIATGTNTVVATTITEYPAAYYVPPVVTAVNGSAGGYRIRLSTHTVDISKLNSMTIPVNNVTLTTSLGSVVGTVVKTNGVFPSTVTVTGLSTTEYYTIPPQVVVTCSYQYSGTDTFTFTLRPLTDTNTVVKTWGIGTGVTVVDSINGKVKLTVPTLDTTALISLKGPAEHGYYLKPVYELRLEADTQYNGNFVASVGKVYVR